MADPGSSVYLGREGTGEATIYQPSINPLGALVQERRAQRRDAILQQRAQQRDDLEFERWFNSSIDRPYPIFQRENFVKEFNTIKDKSIQLRIDGSPDRRSEIFEGISSLNERMARAKSVDDFTKDIKSKLRSDREHLYNEKFVKERLNELWKKDISEINPENDVGGVLEHPAAFNYDVSIGKAVKNIDDQLITMTPGQIQNSPLGQYRIVTKNGLRFRDINDPNTIDYILRQNPEQIHFPIRYRVAKADFYNLDVLDPNLDLLPNTNELDKFFEDNYRYKSPNESPDLMNNVRKVVSATLKELQREEDIQQVRTEGMFSKGEGGRIDSKVATKDDYMFIHNNIIAPTLNPIDSDGKFTDEAYTAVTSYIGGLVGNSRIEDARFFIGDGKNGTKKGDPYIEFDVKPISFMGIPSKELSEPKRYNLKDKGTRKTLFEIYSTKRGPSGKKLNLIDYERAIGGNDVLGIDDNNPLDLK